MKKLLGTILLLISVFTVSIVAGQVIRQYVFPTTGEISSVNLSVTWLDGNPVTDIDWGATENSTAYVLEPINITNISNIPVNLMLSTDNLSDSIITLTLTWNYTGNTLQPSESEIIELYQTVTATGSYSYDTVINATET